MPFSTIFQHAEGLNNCQYRPTLLVFFANFCSWFRKVEFFINFLLVRMVFVCPHLISRGSDCLVPLISSFDPWRSGLCTCPPKLTFNPYTGCDHQCTYCYASSYIPHFKDCHPKKDALSMLKREAAKLKGEIISISNSSDPYPKVEATEGLTRRCLEILVENNCKLQIITKSNLVTRDDDLLVKIPSTIALTLTTDDDDLAKILEPFAPSPSQRIRAAHNLIKAGIPVSVRIDPIIPHVNDQPQRIIKILSDIGVLLRSKQKISEGFPVSPETLRAQSLSMF